MKVLSNGNGKIPEFFTTFYVNIVEAGLFNFSLFYIFTAPNEVKSTANLSAHVLTLTHFSFK